MKKIKVLAVDDSALMRKMMSSIIDSQPDMEIVAVAPDPLVARDLIKLHNPDVLTLDVEMPRMDGLEFLDRLMRLRPMPVVMVSSLTNKGSEITLNALELGAVDFIAKPQMTVKHGMELFSEQLVEKVRIAAKVEVSRRLVPVGQPKLLSSPLISNGKIIAIGSSTGGTEALREILTTLPATSPPIVIAQHMPAGFTRSFADRLNRLCQIDVKEAENGDQLLPGHAFIAPGGLHMEVNRKNGCNIISLGDMAPVNRHKPSVDMLYNSVARSMGNNAVGVILTGMGHDGAQGLLNLHLAGAQTLAQSEKTCVVYGMPREAVALNSACEVVDLHQIGQRMLTLAANNGRRF